MRTTVAAVKEILNTNLSTPQLTAFITDVNLWVTEQLATLSPPASNERLEVIERYLACAMIRLREVTGSALTAATIGDVSESYALPASVRDYLDTAAGFDATGTVRRHFLAPRPVAAPVLPTLPHSARFGPGFQDET